MVAPDGRWLKVNRSICEITGYSEAELLQGRFQDITHPEDLELDLVNVQRLLSGELKTYHLEKRYFHKNGAIVWGMLSVSLVMKDGAPLFFISQVQDISALKEGEEKLAAAAEEIKKLRQGLLKVCAWTKRIEINDSWVPIEEFLSHHLQLKLTHGMSDEAVRLFGRNTRSAPNG